MTLRALLETAREWRGDGKKLAAAVVVKTWGSAPCPAGARLFVREDGVFAGSVSGGCIESEVVAAATESLSEGKPQTLNFGIADETAWEAGLSCGGKMQVFVHLPQDKTLNSMREKICARQTATVTTDLSTGEQTVAGDDNNGSNGIVSAATVCEKNNRRLLVEKIRPAPRILIIGATHIAQHLAKLAETLEMETVIADPRAAWANPERFPNANVRRQWGEDFFAQTPPGKTDAVVALTHDPKIDDPALLAAMNAKPGYIGALGSRRTHEKRLLRLREAGASEKELQKICAPVGLDIGAQNPAQIALAVLAQIVAAFNGKPQK